MEYKRNSKESLPDRKTVLQFINGQNISETVIDFYSKYILKISELTLTDPEHSFEIKYIDRDLMQDLYVSLLECLPNLKKNIIRHLDVSDDFSIKIKA